LPVEAEGRAVVRVAVQVAVPVLAEADQHLLEWPFATELASAEPVEPREPVEWVRVLRPRSG